MNVQKRFVGLSLSGALLFAFSPGVKADDAWKRKERAHTHLIEARRLAADYRIDKAADKARDALKDDPSLAEAHVYLGLQRFRANDLKEAESTFNVALRLDPYQAAAHCYLAYSLYQEGQLESATDHWTLAARLDPTSPQALAGLALSQFKHGEEDNAARTFQKVLLYDKRFQDLTFLQNERGPKWSGVLLKDFSDLVAKMASRNYP